MTLTEEGDWSKLLSTRIDGCLIPFQAWKSPSETSAQDQLLLPYHYGFGGVVSLGSSTSLYDPSWRGRRAKPQPIWSYMDWYQVPSVNTPARQISENLLPTSQLSSFQSLIFPGYSTPLNDTKASSSSPESFFNIKPSLGILKSDGTL